MALPIPSLTNPMGLVKPKAVAPKPASTSVLPPLMRNPSNIYPSNPIPQVQPKVVAQKPASTSVLPPLMRNPSNIYPSNPIPQVQPKVATPAIPNTPSPKPSDMFRSQGQGLDNVNLAAIGAYNKHPAVATGGDNSQRLTALGQMNDHPNVSAINPARPTVPTVTTAPNANGAPGSPVLPQVDMGFQSKLNQNDPAAIGGAMDAARISAQQNQNQNNQTGQNGITGGAPTTLKTSDGKTINPATGGVSEPTEAEIAAQKAADAYSGTLTQTPEELAAQAERDALAANYGLDVNANRQRTVAMPFITGAEAALERSYNLNAGTLEQRMARLQASRIASQNVSKFQLERADKAVAREQGIADKKAEAETKANEPFVLGQGQRRYKADGTYVENPKDATAAGDKNVQTVKDKAGNVYERQTDGTWKNILPAGGPAGESNKLTMDAYNQVIQIENAVNSDAGFTSAVGVKGISSLFGLKKQPFEGSQAFDFQKKVDALSSMLTLDNIKYLKGTGAITDKEEEILKGAATTLSTKISEEAFKAELERVKGVLSKAVNDNLNQNNQIDTSDPDFQALKNDPDMQGVPDEIIWQTLQETLGKPNAGSGANNAQLTPLKVGNKEIKVSPQISGRLSMADAEFFNATGKHLQINEAYRDANRQKILYEAYKAGTGGRAAPPGQSFHEKGLAVDVANWKEAEPYLRKYGLKNDLADDRNHFSLGEFA